MAHIRDQRSDDHVACDSACTVITTRNVIRRQEETQYALGTSRRNERLLVRQFPRHRIAVVANANNA